MNNCSHQDKQNNLNSRVADCIFCKIIVGELPAEIIKETSDILVIKDKFPKASIHYLFIPKKHYHDLQAVPPADCCLLSKMLKLAQLIGQETGDYKLVINNGYKAGQRVFHLHMHFLAGSNIQEV